MASHCVYPCRSGHKEGGQKVKVPNNAIQMQPYHIRNVLNTIRVKEITQNLNGFCQFHDGWRNTSDTKNLKAIKHSYHIKLYSIVGCYLQQRDQNHSKKGPP